MTPVGITSCSTERPRGCRERSWIPRSKGWTASSISLAFRVSALSAQPPRALAIPRQSLRPELPNLQL